jgi:hypothetical protein
MHGSKFNFSSGHADLLLVVVRQFHVVRISVFPAKADAVLVVHANAILPGPISFERLQLISRWRPEVRQDARPVQQP